jgi:hypothetical protein
MIYANKQWCTVYSVVLSVVHLWIVYYVGFYELFILLYVLPDTLLECCGQGLSGSTVEKLILPS